MIYTDESAFKKAIRKGETAYLLHDGKLIRMFKTFDGDYDFCTVTSDDLNDYELETKDKGAVCTSSLKSAIEWAKEGA